MSKIQNKIDRGVFYTKDDFSDLSHRYLENEFGLNWQDEFIIWDCSCGEGSLTRSLVSDNIYLSSNDTNEVDNLIVKNKLKFYFDFLNDDNSKLPNILQDDFKSGKKILMLINPPYAKAASKVGGGRVSAGNAETKICDDMRDLNIGLPSQQLYAQFLFRIMTMQWVNKNVYVGVFSPNSFLTGSSYKEFRRRWLLAFDFKSGFIFKASNFKDVKDDWSICFSVWSPCKPQINILNKKKQQLEFVFDLVEYNKNKTKLKKSGIKILYNLDNKQTATDWLKEDSISCKSYDVPNLSNPFKVRDDGEGRMTDNAFGYFLCSGNNIHKNRETVAMFTTAFSGRRGYSVQKTNFYKCSMFFTCRQLVNSNWINWQDEYNYPNVNHDEFEQFKYDSLVYSLFAQKSYQSSLRGVVYKGVKYDIKNEFFWMPRSKILELSTKNNNYKIIEDLKNSNDRFISTVLFKNDIYDKLSEDIKELVDYGSHLVEISFPFREEFAHNHPEYHLNSWDAGFVQIKKILNGEQNLKNSLLEWKRYFQSVSHRMLPQVYNLSFLRK